MQQKPVISIFRTCKIKIFTSYIFNVINIDKIQFSWHWNERRESRRGSSFCACLQTPQAGIRPRTSHGKGKLRDPCSDPRAMSILLKGNQLMAHKWWENMGKNGHSIGKMAVNKNMIPILWPRTSEHYGTVFTSKYVEKPCHFNGTTIDDDRFEFGVPNKIQ